MPPATGEQEAEEGEDEAEPDRGDKEARRTERVCGRRWWMWWLLPGILSDVLQWATVDQSCPVFDRDSLVSSLS